MFKLNNKTDYIYLALIYLISIGLILWITSYLLPELVQIEDTRTLIQATILTWAISSLMVISYNALAKRLGPEDGYITGIGVLIILFSGAIATGVLDVFLDGFTIAHWSISAIISILSLFGGVVYDSITKDGILQ